MHLVEAVDKVTEKDTYDGKTPGIYVFDAELKSRRYELDTGFLPRIEVTVLPEEKGPAIIGFSELDEAVAVQNLPLGAKESDIVLPDTLEVEVEAADETLAEDSQNMPPWNSGRSLCSSSSFQVMPEIYVMVGDAGVALLADEPYNLNGNNLVIDKDNVGWFNGKTITGT